MNVFRKPLLAAVTMLSKVVDHRATLPILSHIALRQEGTVLHMAATNLETSLTLDLTPTTDDPERLGDPIAVPAKEFLAVLKNLTDEIVSLKTLPDANNNPTLSVSGITLLALGIEEFPVVSAPTNKPIVIPNLAAAIARVVETRSYDESRFALCGVNLDPKGSVVSTDGHRLYRATIAPTKGFSATILPGKFAELLGTPAFRKFVSPDTIHIGDAQIAVPITSASITGWFLARAVEGTFPNYEQVIPGDDRATTTLAVEKADLLSGLAKAMAVATDPRTRPVELIIEDGRVQILGQSETGKAEIDLTGIATGENLIIGLNGHYLKHALESCTSDTLTLRFTGWQNPMWLHDGVAPKKKLPASWVPMQLTIVIMPMRMRDQGRKAA